MAKFYPSSFLSIDIKDVYTLTGTEINTKMKQLSLSGDENTTITQIIETFEEPDNSKRIEYITDDNYSAYIWFDSGIIYLHSNSLLYELNSDMSSLFYNLTKLTGVKLEHWGDKFKTVLNVSNMFKNTAISDYVPIMQNWYFDSVLIADSMFESCTNLTTAEFGYIRFGLGIISLNRFFYNDSKLKTVNWQIYKYDGYNTMISAIDMFYGCFALETANIYGVSMPLSFTSSPSLNQTSVKYILGNSNSIIKPPGGILDFTGCIGINNMANDDPDAITALSNGWIIKPTLTGPVYLTTGSAFNSKINKSMVSFIESETPPTVATQDISLNGDKSIVTWFNTQSLVQYYYCDKNKVYLNPNCSNMFSGCSSLISLDMGIFDIKTPLTDMSHMFEQCSALTLLDITSLTTNSVTNMSYMFADCSSLTSIDISNINTSNVINMEAMFYGMTNLQSLDILPLYNTTLNNVTNAKKMFMNCSSLPTVTNVDRLKLPKVTTVSGMFAGCTSMVTVSFRQFASNILVADMSRLLQDCSSLTTILYPEQLKTSNVTDMSYMFAGCSKLVSLNVSTFDTAKVTNMSNMFNGMSSLTTLTINSLTFITTNVTDMSYMFANLVKLPTVSLIYFNTLNVTNMRYMFYNYGTANASISFYGSSFTNVAMDQNLFKYDNDMNPTYKMYEGSNGTRPGGSMWATGTYISGTYCLPEILVSGAEFNSAMNKNMKNFVISSIAPEGTIAISDISQEKNGSIKTWYDIATNTQYIYTKYEHVYMNTNSSGMFKDCINAQSIDLSLFEGKNTTNTSYMFSNCKAIKNINMSTFDFVNVTDMNHMFDGCLQLENLNLFTSATTKVTNMNAMFKDCSSIIDIPINNVSFRSDALTDAGFMFSGCTSLTSITFGAYFQTKACLSMIDMFQNCSSLTTLNIYNFSTVRVQYMNAMFSGCANLTSITYNTSTFVNQNMLNIESQDLINGTYNMFKNCPANKPTWTNGSWTTDTQTFIENITYLAATGVIQQSINAAATGFIKSSTPYYGTVTDISKIQNKSIVTWYDAVAKIQYWYSSRQTVYFDTTTTSVFSGKSALKTIDIVGWNSSMLIDFRSMFNNCSALETLTFNFDTSKATNMANMFNNCSNLKSLDISNFITTNVTDMSYMFARCSSLTSLNLSNFNTTNVTTMSNMFYGCYSLTILDVSNFDTRNVTNMEWMFRECSSIKSLNLSNFQTPKLTTLYCTFLFCSKLTDLNISNFDTTNVTNMKNMFQGVSSMLTLDLSNLITSSVTVITNIFNGCTSLTSLNISNFDTSKVSQMIYAFSGCINLSTIIFGENFVRTSLGSLTVSHSGNPTYQAFRSTPSNKPDWSGGSWDANGTFVATS